jgi:hypothetical protein
MNGRYPYGAQGRDRTTDTAIFRLIFREQNQQDREFKLSNRPTEINELPWIRLFFPPDITIQALREHIVALAEQHRLPAIYMDEVFVKIGGLASYGADRIEIFRRAAGYVDRILHGEKPSELPFQEPTKYRLMINLKAAKALDLTVPPTLLATADEVIE